ncbi:MAG TPA: hydrogenase expression/formation protein HypE [Thermodesulfobacteriota bacterium]|nr:hydrogenase expression/formation protein HypE [Thermodesulfobacteriota bacterium]
MSEKGEFVLSCPLPITNYKNILLGHGSGGKLSADLTKKIFLSQFDNPYLEPLNDAAVFEVNGTRLAFTTDSYVINPIFFPGGDIGKLAVNGTVNDLSVSGAKPLYISAAFILEEGFPIEDLWKIVISMKSACEEAGVSLVTGDTKVVNKGKGDKVFINTSGVGIVEKDVLISSDRAKPGDKVILSGSIGVHGIAIMSVREGIEFETQIQSDTAPLTSLIMDMLSVSTKINCMRDPTRGGVASTLNEIASSSKVGIRIEENKIPMIREVKGACEMLGLDPLYVANEGKLIAIVNGDDAESIVEKMRTNPLGREAVIIGEVISDHPGIVFMKTKIGGTRVVDMLTGEQLPRIC